MVLERSIFAFDGFDLRGIGGVQNVQFRVACDFAERHAQNFRTQAGAAHAQQQRVLEAGLFYVGGNVLQRGNVGELFLGDSQPAQPLVFIGAGPE